MTFDSDLRSIQEARTLSATAKEAQLEFSHFSQQQVDAIVKAMAEAGYAAAERLARMAVDESGFGNYEDKIIKNRFGTKNVYESIKDLKTAGIVDIEANGKIIKIGVPMGVVCASRTFYQSYFHSNVQSIDLIEVQKCCCCKSSSPNSKMYR